MFFYQCCSFPCTFNLDPGPREILNNIQEEDLERDVEKAC